MVRQSLHRYRAYATNTGRNASPRKFPFTLAATAVVGATAVAFAVRPASKRRAHNNGLKTEPVPTVEPAADVGAIEVVSPVQALSLREANDKVREGARVFEFATDGGGGKGRVDVVRVASNSPVEDEWAVGVGSGVGGERLALKSLYAGVYDGHA
jgi:pyruvate dehydrogenase phosphatase